MEISHVPSREKSGLMEGQSAISGRERWIILRQDNGER
jgi:hypothetical protein